MICNLIVVIFCFGMLNMAKCQGGGGGNNGPIFDTHVDHFCQDKIFPHFPVIEEWINGDWTVSYLYQQVESRPIYCSKLNIATDSNLQNKSIVTQTFYDGSGQETRLVKGYRSSPTTPAKLIIDSHTDGIIGKGSKYPSTFGMETVTFLSFASGSLPSERDHYETGLYVVCYQGNVGESYALGVPFISEVGIVTRNGIIEEYQLEHYVRVLSQITGYGLPEVLVLKPLETCENAMAIN